MSMVKQNAAVYYWMATVSSAVAKSGVLLKMIGFYSPHNYDVEMKEAWIVLGEYLEKITSEVPNLIEQ